MALEPSDLGHHRPPRRKTVAGWLEPVRHKGLLCLERPPRPSQNKADKRGPGPLSSILCQHLGHHSPPRRKTAAGWLEPVRHKGLLCLERPPRPSQNKADKRGPGPLSSILCQHLGHHSPPRRKTAAGWLKPFRHKGLTLPRAAAVAKPEAGRQKEARGPLFSIAYSEN